MITASYEYPSMSVVLVQVMALVALAALVAYLISRPGDRWWESPIVRVFALFGALVYPFMAWVVS